MIEFIRNKETGILEVWKDGKKTGSIITMGDVVGNIRLEDTNAEKNSR